jgi:hypothetical protein
LNISSLQAAAVAVQEFKGKTHQQGRDILNGVLAAVLVVSVLLQDFQSLAALRTP